MSKLKTIDELIRDGWLPDDAKEKAINELVKRINQLEETINKISLFLVN